MLARGAVDGASPLRNSLAVRPHLRGVDLRCVLRGKTNAAHRRRPVCVHRARLRRAGGARPFGGRRRRPHALPADCAPAPGGRAHLLLRAPAAACLRGSALGLPVLRAALYDRGADRRVLCCGTGRADGLLRARRRGGRHPRSALCGQAHQRALPHLYRRVLVVFERPAALLPLGLHHQRLYQLDGCQQLQGAANGIRHVLAAVHGLRRALRSGSLQPRDRRARAQIAGLRAQAVQEGARGLQGAHAAHRHLPP